MEIMTALTYQRPDWGDQRADQRDKISDDARARGDRDQTAKDHEKSDDLGRADRRDSGRDLTDRDELSGPDRGERHAGGDGGASGQGLDRGAAGGEVLDRTQRKRALVYLRDAVAALHQAGGIKTNEPVDHLRDRLAGAVQSIGERVRQVSHSLRHYGARALEKVRDLLLPDRDPGQPSERARGAAHSSDRSLEQADRVNRSTDQQREQIDERVSSKEREAERAERIAEITQKHRGESER